MQNDTGPPLRHVLANGHSRKCEQHSTGLGLFAAAESHSPNASLDDKFSTFVARVPGGVDPAPGYVILVLVKDGIHDRVANVETRIVVDGYFVHASR